MYFGPGFARLWAWSGCSHEETTLICTRCTRFGRMLRLLSAKSAKELTYIDIADIHLLEDTWLVQCLLVHQIRFSGADWSDSLGVLQDGSWELGSISRNLICAEANHALMCWCLPNSVRTMHWLCSFQSEIVLNSPWTLRMHALWQRTLPFICCPHAVFEGFDFPLVFSSNPQALPHHYWATTLDQRVWDVQDRACKGESSLRKMDRYKVIQGDSRLYQDCKTQRLLFGFGKWPRNQDARETETHNTRETETLFHTAYAVQRFQVLRRRLRFFFATQPRVLVPELCFICQKLRDIPNWKDAVLWCSLFVHFNVSSTNLICACTLVFIGILEK